MLRWTASPVLGLFCLLAMTPALLTWTVEGAGVARARAATLSTGVLSDQGEPGPADPPGTPPATPFGRFQPPDTKIAAVVSPPADPLVANVEGHPIYLSDLGDAVKSLPEGLGKMPFAVIYPTLLDRMIDHEALVLLARRKKLDDDPAVQRQIRGSDRAGAGGRGAGSHGRAAGDEAREGLRVRKFNMDGTPMGVPSGAGDPGAPVPDDALNPRTSDRPDDAAPVPAAPQAPQKTGN